MGRGAAVCNLGLLPHRTAYCRALSRHYLLLHAAAYPEPPYLAVLSALHRFRAMKWNRVTDCGLLPLPITGQPGIFRLIPSLARKTHHSTVSWRLVGWHPAMDTRACFCSNIEKSRHILDWTRTSISELSVRHSAIELHAQGGHNLDCS